MTTELGSTTPQGAPHICEIVTTLFAPGGTLLLQSLGTAGEPAAATLKTRSGWSAGKRQRSSSPTRSWLVMPKSAPYLETTTPGSLIDAQDCQVISLILGPLPIAEPE